MARTQSRYVCQTCGDVSLRWAGQCPACGEWNTLVETVVRETPKGATRRASAAGPTTGPDPTLLAAIAGDAAPRRPVGIDELDRVLGGGLVAGSIIVVGGEPGIGKSTILLQAAAGVAVAGDPVLYASGEESVGQVHLRAERLGLLGRPAAEAIRLVAESDVDRIVELVRMLRPALVVVDSIQTTRSDDLDGPPGSVGQVRECAARLGGLAKDTGIPVVLVGHVTKDGALAGPRTLEHVVDVVLSLEGERYGSLRLLRAAKNRFGSTEEVGVFEMAGDGLAGVADPARAFLAEHDAAAPGSVVGIALEGTRPLLVEVQALVAASGYGTPARRASGVDPNRLALLLAVLGRRAGVGLGSHDVYTNLAGGLTLDDPALDLPLAIALASSLRDRPIATGTVAVGEVGLLGELRAVPGLERRLREAARLGFGMAVVPGTDRRGRVASATGIEVVPVGSLREALAAVLEPRGAAPAPMLGSPGSRAGRRGPTTRTP